ncbi:protein tyrosine phosphatase domain-containing protein 1 isoform X2 [Paramormyrops kingsleyae]
MAAGLGLQGDLPSTGGASSGATGAETGTVTGRRVPTAKYTKVGERLRHVIPGHMQCSMACGGRSCKYENPSRWSEGEQAVKGLYSSWITDNLLAMARPSTEVMVKYNVIEQFQRCGVKTVINLQRPGEHASCGKPLEQASGFTYRPEAFMEAGIYFYNFGWKDYGVASLTTILDMLKVMSFAVQEGKLAVHCHAGLGRTGVLMACYLVFTTRMSADQAILFVRAKRPNSIQTRGQLLCVREFAQFLVPLRKVFSGAEPRVNPVTLSQYLTRQRHLLHGYEARRLKNVPKIVQLACKVLLDIAEDRQATEEEVIMEIPDLTAEVEKTVSQQAIQQLGKEMIGKGIAVTPPCASGPPTLAKLPSEPLPKDPDPWNRQSTEWAKPTSDLRKTRSYSESDLHSVRLVPSWPEGPLTFLTGLPPAGHLSKARLSYDDLAAVPLSSSPLAHRAAAFKSEWSPLSAWEPRGRLDMDDSTPPLSRRRPLSEVRHRVSLGPLRMNQHTSASVSGAPGDLSDSPYEASSKIAGSASTRGSDAEGRTEGPLGSIQTEISPQVRRLLVAQALASELDQDGMKRKNEVLRWQSELNSREGAWERLCVERDPFVLAGLMWSWLEQLKEPVISKEDVQSLARLEPWQALDSLDKGPRQTLLCILNCVARVAAIPAELEAAFLQRTIKAFTQMGPDSNEGEAVYEALKGILTPVLCEMRLRVAEETEGACYCLQDP